MKRGFVPTENYRRLKEAETIVAKRGAREAGLVLVRGVYGIGKSELTERWAADSGYVFVRAKETWTTRAMLDELAERMGLSKKGRNQEVQARIIQRIAIDMVPIIIDEADFLVRGSGSLLEVIRDITDLTGTMCFLVGMEHFAIKVDRLAHIRSRVARVVDFHPLSLADVQATITAKSEVPMAADMAEEILRQAQGRMRLVLNAIASIELWAKTNGWKEVTRAHIAGKPLCVEFTGVQLGRTGKGAA
ncbi:ATP-binding protein [Piscinibacter sakaiensis]|uniref:Mobile element protein n=1 Tax=Piscinibacter sakaiensis TaxID=1547922 RepID=A0A0K8P8L3_PISS1|nr:ATP-binding protein [Piscinibacter sakaiensis]GAP38982.1 mobile element protein [Piscinibacter sakaiensis]